MVDGLWSMEFRSSSGGQPAGGWGVVVLKDGRVLGGDSCFSVVGNYKLSLNSNQLESTVEVKRFRTDPNFQSILGRGMDNYSLKLSGAAKGNEFTLLGQVVENPQMKMTVTLRRQTNN